MKKEQFLRVLGDIDDDLIVEAAAKPKVLPRYVRIAGGIAACLVIALAAVIAAPRIGRVAHDAAAECAPMEEDFTFSADMENSYAAADDALMDKFAEDTAAAQSGASGNGAGKPSQAPAETAAVATRPTAKPVEPESVPETSLPQPLMGRTFYFYDGKTWRTDTKTYPGGLPSMQGIVRDWLKAAGIQASCTSAVSKVVGEKTEVKGDIVIHTAGVRTWYIKLDGDITPAQCKALVNTVLESASPSSLYLVEVETPNGKYAPSQASPIQ